MMASDYILALLISERDKLTTAIEALQGPTKRKGRPPGSGRKAVQPSVEQDSKPRGTTGPTASVKRKLSAAGRRAIIAATKKRWATIKAAKAAAVPAQVAAAPKAAPAMTPVVVKKGGLTAGGLKALSIAVEETAEREKEAGGEGIMWPEQP